MSWEWGGWRPYVSVAERRAKARRYAQQLEKKGRKLQPVESIAGRTIAKTFWGQAWCQNLERYSDFANRLPRGRTYARNGSVIDLQIARGKVTALVSGSEIYEVEVSISTLSAGPWEAIKRDCAQSIDSLLDLLQGRFSQGVMERLTRPKEGLFPQPKEIEIRCSCPDYATLCKHAAAVLYGVGARLDTAPETLFLLRQVDHRELIRQAVDGANLDAALGAPAAGALEGADLGELFGIDLDTGETTASMSKAKGAVRKHQQRRKAANASAENSTSPAQSTKASPKKKTKATKKAASRPSPKKRAAAAAGNASKKAASTPPRKSAKAKKKSSRPPQPKDK
jgi:uncharacterized Zn finger protein